MSHILQGKVALFMPSLAGGGAEGVFIRLSELLHREGIAVDLVVASAVGEYAAQIPAGVSVVNLDKGKPSRAVPALVSYLKQNTPETLLSTLTHANLAAIMASLLARVPTRCVVREAASPIDDLIHDTHSDRFLKKLLVPFLYNRTHRILAPSHGVAEGIAMTYGIAPEKISVIYNPVDPAEIKKRCTAPPEIDGVMDRKIPTLVAVGRLCYQKGYDLLLNAAARLKSEGRDFRIVILGEGELRSELELLRDKLGLTRQILMPGFVTNPHAFIARSSGYISASRWEGLSNILIEAMCCGVPVAASSCRHGQAEILEDGKQGLLFASDNIDQLSQAMVALLEERVSPPDESTLSRFSPASISQQYQQLLLGM